ncbi:hypothetical protein A6A26_03855 [Pantoea sp. OXWO6B1]|nr:hypothetical protein A6A26_03855 [Pantoea sp. OXWO6B1]
MRRRAGRLVRRRTPDALKAERLMLTRDDIFPSQRQDTASAPQAGKQAGTDVCFPDRVKYHRAAF